jgi:D-alanyl-lipoteichoic acid acyltransferase DltB (MBOAT superfamily)
LTLGVGTDIALLAWFKYANFVVDNLNFLGADLAWHNIALPLAISFFTFQKIAYLVDSAQGKARRMSFGDFTLFAAFFPQLIAGPIVHYSEIVPQLRRRLFSRLSWRNVMVGLVIFSIGLFKKTVIADSLVAYVDPLFGAAEKGVPLGVVAGWLAAVTYTFQLYFDFSGYSDMAIGLGRMLGVKLPLNFHSPLRARSMLEYWRRWHMTLQRFLVAYVFSPTALPLNRLAARLRLDGWAAFGVGVLGPVVITFMISGIWHGAGWTFILWGVLHAFYIAVNEIWREFTRRRSRARRRAGLNSAKPGLVAISAYHGLTLLAVVFANVMFRAKSVSAAISIYLGMIWPGAWLTPAMPQPFDAGLAGLLVVSAVIVFAMPNTQQIMGRFDPALNWREWRTVGPALMKWTWRPSPLGIAFAGVVLFLGVIFIQRGRAIFIYFNF